MNRKPPGKALAHATAAWLVLILLSACATAPQPASPGTLVPADLAFSTALVQRLSRSGLAVLSVQGSTYAAMFPSTGKAAWIRTDQGILDAVFFDDPAAAGQIHVTQSPGSTGGRFLYILRASPPVLLHDQTIDAAFPLYFTTAPGMFLLTGSAPLDRSLKRIFPGP